MGQTTSSTAIWLVDAVLGQPEDLPQLADVERVLPQVIRVLGQNPGQLTLQGTNTYLVGTGPQRVLIDTSDGNSYWWPLIQQVLSEEGAEITEVLLTHSHYDHMGNMFEVRSSFPQASIHKWLPCVLGDKDCEQFTAGSLAKTFSKGRRMRGCGCDGQVPPGCQSLYEGQVFAAGDRTLRVLLTPGHSTDSACFALEHDNRVEAIFTGDSVLGGRTARFGDLASYNQSLGRLLRIAMDQGNVLLLPGHGDVVAASDSEEYLQSILRMQRTREKAILRTLQVSPGTAGDLCSMLYGSGAAALMAQDLVEQHLEDLRERGRVKRSEGVFGRIWWEAARLVPTGHVS